MSKDQIRDRDLTDFEDSCKTLLHFPELDFRQTTVICGTSDGNFYIIHFKLFKESYVTYPVFEWVESRKVHKI